MFSVTKTLITEFDSEYVSGIAVTCDGSVVFWGRENGELKLKLFNLKTNTEVFTENLTDEPYGVTQLKLGEKPALVISNR